MTEIAEVAAAADRVEAAMREAGMWQDAPLDPAQYDFRMAFAMDTMAFSQWLQFVFLPRVREIVAGGGSLPGASNVAAQAVREFDGMQDSAGPVLDALIAFDALFD
jgi:uncharacterized protein YqcC (DUF446 family)